MTVDVLQADRLVKEYLLFRGFHSTLRSLDEERSADKALGFQVETIVALIFDQLIPQLELPRLLALLQYLEKQFFGRLDVEYSETVRILLVLFSSSHFRDSPGQYESNLIIYNPYDPQAKRLENSILRLYIVVALSRGRRDAVLQARLDIYIIIARQAQFRSTWC